MENKLTGFDLLLFLSNDLMHIQHDPENNEISFIATEELAEALTQRVGFEISVDLLQQVLAKFAEYAATATMELVPNIEGEVQ